MKKQLLVLDLDETLVRTTDTPIFGRQPDLIWNNLYIYKRPFLTYFLLDTSRLYDIGIWSAGMEDYVQTIVNHFIPKNIQLQFVYSKQHCENVNGVYVGKPLTKDVIKNKTVALSYSNSIKLCTFCTSNSIKLYTCTIK